MHEFRSNFGPAGNTNPVRVLFCMTHQRNDYRNIFHPAMDDNMDSLFGLYPENMFLIKLNLIIFHIIQIINSFRMI
jgi:hypothetical protein